MPSCAEVLAELVALSRELGRPELDYAILGEGNTSACCGDGTFLVKASGTSLSSASPQSFVRCDRQAVLALLALDSPNDATVASTLRQAAGAAGPMPSVETLLHAICLTLDGVRFVGHTHPTPVVSLTCSARFFELCARPVFPDQIVLLGQAPVLVPYCDPGVPLARAVHRLVSAHVATHGEYPRMILMQNHGLVVLGGTARQVADRTAMAVKAARVLLGAAGVGAVTPLSPAHVERIHVRPDEHYRKQQLGL